MPAQIISDVAFTPAVKEQQERLGSRNAYARMEQKGGWSATISDDLAEFIATRNSFYLGTASAEGQPYIQHRGGPVGFLKVLDERTLAFADFGGNKQYISTGNLSENDRAFIFLMDYANRRRIKIWGAGTVRGGRRQAGRAPRRFRLRRQGRTRDRFRGRGLGRELPAAYS